MSALSPIARQEYHAELGNSLPPPVLDQPEFRQRRIATAVETFEALRPGDAYEARLAVQIVLCGAHAADCLREAGLFLDDFAKRSRCRAQAASLTREEHASKRMLAREQKLRLAAEAVAGTPPAQPATASAPPQQAATRAAPAQVQAGSAPPPSPEALAQAEAFVEQNVVAAAQIRHDRGVTPQSKARFHDVTLPTDPAVIDALVRGTSELLILLDDLCGETLDKAA
jgi:hypothetical protein